MPRDDDKRERTVRCSFCQKTQDQVEKLIAGPGVYICNECVEQCLNIIEVPAARAVSARVISRSPSPMRSKRSSTSML